MKSCLVLAAILTITLSATTTGSMYSCFNSRNCFQQFKSCNISNPEPLNDTQAQEANKCVSAVATRDLCLIKNNCTFSETDEYTYDCWHCWAGVITSSKQYEQLVDCINPCYKHESRLLPVLLAVLLMIALYL